MYKLFIGVCLAVLQISARGSKDLNFEDEFQKAQEKGMFAPIAEERARACEIPWREMQKIQQAHDLQVQERDKALKEAAAGCEEQEICRLISRVVSFHPTHHQEEALKYMGSLHHKAVNSSHSRLENQLIAIDYEYQCRELLADFLLLQGTLTALQKNSMIKQMRMEKHQKMLDAASHSSEHALARKIEEAYEFYPYYIAYRKDVAYLEALGRGDAEPANPIEEKVKAVMARYTVRG